MKILGINKFCNFIVDVLQRKIAVFLTQLPYFANYSLLARKFVKWEEPLTWRKQIIFVF